MTEGASQTKVQPDPIEIDKLVSYLERQGWQKLNHPNPRLLFFQGSNDDLGNPIDLVLPITNNFEDSYRLISKAVNLLAIVENKSPQEIIDLVSKIHLDRSIVT